MMVTNKILTLLAVLLFVFCASVAGSYAATINAASASYSHVSSAVSSATYGDTVVVPSGAAEWSSTLEITEGITLQGAGTDNTTITGNVGNSAYLIKYRPSTPYRNDAFRLTGFTFDLNNNSLGLDIHSSSYSPVNNKIRIDHTEWLNCILGNDGKPVWKIRNVFGVADNNTFTGEVHIDNLADQVTSWTNLVYVPGSADNFYYEDNTFSSNFTHDSGGWGGRYCKRYNTYNLVDPMTSSRSLSGFYPLFDAHGNQSSGVYTTMGVEIYGNLINNPGNWSLGPFLDHRGGKALVFYNRVVSTGKARFNVTDEHADSAPIYNPTDGTPQRPNHGYYWNNRKTGDILITASEGTDIENLVEENDEFFNHNASFDGTAGIGCGTLATMQAIKTCTEGVGFWVTDQSCSSVDTANVGANPTTPISGTLYRCNDSNTWVVYYTPYTYPHPLRGYAHAPHPPSNLRIVEEK